MALLLTLPGLAEPVAKWWEWWWCGGWPLWKMLEGAAADVGTMPTVSMTGVPAEATLPGAALAVATTADEAEGVKWESLSAWE